MRREASRMSIVSSHRHPVRPRRPACVCRNCGATVPLGPMHACYECFGPLEVGYDERRWRAVTRDEIEAGPANIWRYAAAAPGRADPGRRGSASTPACTPLVRADNLGRELGMKAPLWVKDDSANPTHSFKDRVVSMAPPPAARSASPASPAPRPATSPTRSPRTPPGPACGRSSSSRPTWSRARSCRPPSTAVTLVASRRLLRRRQPALLRARRDRRVRGHRLRQP